MLLGVIADDFTGASDVANTLARGGMATRIFVGDTVADGAEAGVIALKTRSVPAAEAVAQSLTALARLRAAGCRQILFKYCSTFDSTPHGNIGPVAQALATALSATGVVVCPAFPATGRRVFQGHLFVGDRLLSESGMERHPLTPMTDPDIRRWLARQCTSAPAHLPLDVVRQGSDAVRAALAKATGLVVVDAVDEADLAAIGAAVRDAPLVTGGSGIAIGLPGNFRDAGLLGGAGAGFRPCDGPALVVSGSCSNATRDQVARHAATHPAHEIDVAALMHGADERGRAAAFLARHRADVPLVFSSADPARVAALQQQFGQERTAAAVEALLGAIAADAVAAGFARLVACGGETSGAVVTALGIAMLSVGPEIDPGVPALSTDLHGRPLALALKSGNFGGTDFMARAARRLGGEA